MSDEKFISIPFSVWENKYKPMEAENEKLKQELRNKDISVNLDIRFLMQHFDGCTSYTIGKWSAGRIGFLGYSSPSINSEILDDNIIQNLFTSIEEQLRINECRGRLPIDIMTNKEAKSYIIEIEKTNEEMKRRAEKMSQIAADNITKTNSLPRIVKWIFGIKNV